MSGFARNLSLGFRIFVSAMRGVVKICEQSQSLFCIATRAKLRQPLEKQNYAIFGKLNARFFLTRERQKKQSA